MSTQLLTKPLAKYSHARRVGSILFIAGQGCRDPKTNVWAGVTFDTDGKAKNIDFKEQALGVLKNIEDVLTANGLTRKSLVDVQVFLTNMTDQFPVMNEVWNHFFSEIAVPPTRTTVSVAGLPGLNLIEMKAVAEFV